MGDDIVVGFDFAGEERGACEFFEDVDDAVEEGEDEEGFSFGGDGGEEEEVGVVEGEEDCGGREVGEVEKGGTGGRVGEVGLEEGSRGGWAGAVDVLEDGFAGVVG